MSADTPSLEDEVPEPIRARLARVLCKPIVVLGRFVQILPNNWKLYFENVKDSYHASLLHTFYGTFRLMRLTQEGGVTVSSLGGHSVASPRGTPLDRTSSEYRDQGLRSENDKLRLRAPAALLDYVDEFGDGIHTQIGTIFPSFVLQQIQNCLALRYLVPRGINETELHWIHFGFVDDTPEMLRRRLLQMNLVGPAGYVSMEDGCIGGFVRRGTAAAGNELSVVNMGGEGFESQDTRATEVSVRGFWNEYRTRMGL